VGYTIPAAEAKWAFPQEEKTVQIKISPGFGKLVGFNEGAYPETVSNTKLKYTSKSMPQAGKPQSLVITCNLLFSEYYNPVNILCTVPITSKFGGVINYCNPCVNCSNIQEGYHNSINIEFLDQYFNKIQIKDPEVFITLCISGSE
jgi:hypothetical protein